MRRELVGNSGLERIVIPRCWYLIVGEYNLFVLCE